MPRKVEVKSSYHIFRAASVPPDGIHEWVIAAYKSWPIPNWSKFRNCIHNLAITRSTDYKKASQLRNQMSIGSGSRNSARNSQRTSEWPRKREQPQHRQQYWFASEYRKGCTKFYVQPWPIIVCFLVAVYQKTTQLLVTTVLHSETFWHSRKSSYNSSYQRSF